MKIATNSPQDKIIEDTFATISNKLLDFSEEEVDQIFNKIGQSMDSLDKCDELYILEELRNKFEDRRYYYYVRRQRRYDWDAFNIAITLLSIIVVLMYVLYIGIFYYDNTDFSVPKSYDVGVLGFISIILIKCMKKFFFQGIFLLFLGIIIVIIAVFCMIGQWLWPNDKKHYEKWSVVKARIEKRIAFLK